MADQIPQKTNTVFDQDVDFDVQQTETGLAITIPLEKIMSVVESCSCTPAVVTDREAFLRYLVKFFRRELNEFSDLLQGDSRKAWSCAIIQAAADAASMGCGVKHVLPPVKDYIDAMWRREEGAYPADWKTGPYGTSTKFSPRGCVEASVRAFCAGELKLAVSWLAAAWPAEVAARNHMQVDGALEAAVEYAVSQYKPETMRGANPNLLN